MSRSSIVGASPTLCNTGHWPGLSNFNAEPVQHLICAGTVRLVDALNKVTRGFYLLHPGLMAWKLKYEVPMVFRASILFRWASRGPGLVIRPASCRRRIFYRWDRSLKLSFGRPIFRTSSISLFKRLGCRCSRPAMSRSSKAGAARSFAIQVIDQDRLTSMIQLTCAGTVRACSLLNAKRITGISYLTWLDLTVRLVDALNKVIRGFRLLHPGLMA